MASGRFPNLIAALAALLDGKLNRNLNLQDHLVRIGVLGQIGRFQTADATKHGRGASIICRTNRGLEFGTVLNVVQDPTLSVPRIGTILRPATPQDHLLWARLEKNRLSAFHACELLLADQFQDQPNVILMDIELLFDGKSIFFYFLGEMTAELTEAIECLTSQLADVYEAKVQLKKFAETMAQGCGPDCGTQDNCGDSGCASCSIASACSSKRAVST